MKALLLEKLGPISDGNGALRQSEVAIPAPGPGEVLIGVSACGICHTELDEIEGRTAPPRLPVIPGHQVVGKISALGPGSSRWTVGDRVGVAWIYSSCEECSYCANGQQNLCPDFLATGRDRNGGYAEYMVAHQDYIYRIPSSFSDEEAAPLLCAGAIGYRSVRLAQISDGENIGLMGFGASGHQVLIMLKFLYPLSKIFVFARNEKERNFAMELGAHWAGEPGDESPAPVHRIIDTTPVWTTVLHALRHIAPGGRLVINAIRKEDSDKSELAGISYKDHLWMEKEIKSVANICPSDVKDFLEIASQMQLKPAIQVYEIGEVNKALLELKKGQIRGAKVLSFSASVSNN